MLAIDTNVVVRYLVADDVRQTAKAKGLIDHEDVFVLTTVLLETEWVLRGLYHFSHKQVIAALTAFAGLPHVALENASALREALDWAATGLDFADAVHLAGAGQCDALVTFDKAFVKAAKAFPARDVRSL